MSLSIKDKGKDILDNIHLRLKDKAKDKIKSERKPDETLTDTFHRILDEHTELKEENRQLQHDKSEDLKTIDMLRGTSPSEEPQPKSECRFKAPNKKCARFFLKNGKLIDVMDALCDYCWELQQKEKTSITTSIPITQRQREQQRTNLHNLQNRVNETIVTESHFNGGIPSTTVINPKTELPRIIKGKMGLSVECLKDRMIHLIERCLECKNEACKEAVKEYMEN